MRLTLSPRAPAVANRTRRGGASIGLLKLLLGILLLAWAIRALVAAPFSIPSASMLPSLFVGDYVLTTKWPYGYSRYSFPFGIASFDGRIFSGVPERGDIVVFRAPGSAGDFVKRVVGLPGDSVEIRDGVLILNDKAVPRESHGVIEVPVSRNSPCRVVPGSMLRTSGDERACPYRAYRETLPGGRSYLVLDQVEGTRADDMDRIVIPAGHVFLIGDNRDDSLDSRFSPVEGGVGLVPLDNLIGRANLIFWSTDGSADYAKPWTWFPALRARRLGSASSQR